MDSWCRRLYGQATLAQLDEGYGHQVISNYQYILELLQVCVFVSASVSISVSISVCAVFALAHVCICVGG